MTFFLLNLHIALYLNLLSESLTENIYHVLSSETKTSYMKCIQTVSLDARNYKP